MLRIILNQVNYQDSVFEERVTLNSKKEEILHDYRGSLWHQDKYNPNNTYKI